MIQLEVNNICKNFGGLQVLRDVSFRVKGPERIGLIGPNGAGKTTLTNILDGVIKPASGTVYLNGKRIDPLPPFKVAQAGFGRTFQVSRAFRRMTVLENLYVPALAMNPTRQQKDFRNLATEVLEFLTIEHLRNEYARALSGGQLKLLELGRLLMLNPSIFVLDEPFAGVHPKLVAIILQYIKRVNDDGKAVITISHDMDTIFSHSRRLLVLSSGVLIADGDPEIVKRDSAVIEAYLGRDDDDEVDDPSTVRKEG